MLTELLTPMEKMKNELVVFKELIGASLRIEVNSLNKCQIKGVKESDAIPDFMKVIKVKDIDGKDYSLAFNFNYINLTEEKQSVKIHIEIKDRVNKSVDYLKSEEYSIEKMKKKIKNLNYEILKLAAKSKRMDKNRNLNVINVIYNKLMF